MCDKALRKFYAMILFVLCTAGAMYYKITLVGFILLFLCILVFILEMFMNDE
jgi:hypothetical protein